MLAAVVADSRRRTYALFGPFHHHLGRMTGPQARSAPSPRWGEGAHRDHRTDFDYAGPTRSIIAASFGCGARRMAAAPAAASGCETWRERQNCTGASARSRMRARAAQNFR